MDETDIIIKLHNTKGQLVKEVKDFGKKIQPLEITLDISAFAYGIYFYSVYDGDTLVTNGKIIKR
jgi:hypothetical protein